MRLFRCTAMCFAVLTVIVGSSVCGAGGFAGVGSKSLPFIYETHIFQKLDSGCIAWLPRVLQEVLWRRCATIAIEVPAYAALALLHPTAYVHRTISRRFQLLSALLSTILTVSPSYTSKYATKAYLRLAVLCCCSSTR